MRIGSSTGAALAAVESPDTSRKVNPHGHGKIRAVTGLIIEGGVYVLLLFAPFAFGGVEMWAQGIIQILTGLVFTAWCWQRLSGADEPSAGQAPPGVPRAIQVMWVTIGLFVLLVGLQLVPLSPGSIKAISPATYDLYSRAVPGYTGEGAAESTELIPWLIADTKDRMPEAFKSSESTAVAAQAQTGSTATGGCSRWRTLSIYPRDTRTHLTQFLCYAALFAVITEYFRAKDRLRRLFAVVVFSGFAVSLFGIIQRLTWNGKLYWVREGNYPTPI